MQSAVCVVHCALSTHRYQPSTPSSFEITTGRLSRLTSVVQYAVRTLHCGRLCRAQHSPFPHHFRGPWQRNRLLPASRQRTHVVQLTNCATTQARPTGRSASYSPTCSRRASAQLPNNLVRVAEPKAECHEGPTIRAARYEVPAPTTGCDRDDSEGAYQTVEQEDRCVRRWRWAAGSPKGVYQLGQAWS